MLEDTIDAAGRWRTLSLDVTNYGSRSETKRVQVLINPAVYAVTYGPGNPTPLWVAAAITRIDPPTWRRWHRTANRLAPLGVPVEIRDKSGKRCRPWTFPLFSKSPPVPFSVKSWRFVDEANGRHFELLWAAAADKQKAAETVKPAVRAACLGAMPNILAGLRAMHSTAPMPPGPTAAPRPDPLRWRGLGLCWENIPNGVPVFLKLTDDLEWLTTAPHAAPPSIRSQARKWRFTERIDGLAYDFVGGSKPLPEGATVRDGVAYGSVPCDPLRWRETTTQAAGLPKGVAVELDAEKIQVGVLRWRFVDLAEGVAYDAKRAKS